MRLLDPLELLNQPQEDCFAIELDDKQKADVLATARCSLIHRFTIRAKRLHRAERKRGARLP